MTEKTNRLRPAVGLGPCSVFVWGAHVSWTVTWCAAGCLHLKCLSTSCSSFPGRRVEKGVHLPLSHRQDPEVRQKHQDGWEMSAGNVHKVTKTYLTFCNYYGSHTQNWASEENESQDWEYWTLLKKVTRLWVSSFTNVLYHSIFGRVAAPGFFLHRDRK